MLRKKNIELNHKKASGTEVLKDKDEISFFLSDETYNKFVTEKNIEDLVTNKSKNEKKYNMPPIIYEDDNILLINKPAGMLSQKAEKNDISANEICLRYLIAKGELKENNLSGFKPSVCNRLDRNTSGILIFAKTYNAAKQLSEALRDRTIHKYYTTIVCGTINSSNHIKGYLYKDEKLNKVYVSDHKIDDKYSYIDTKYIPLKIYGDYTLLEVELLTGKSHQIRAHLSYIGNPILGDDKYGNKKHNSEMKKILALKGIKLEGQLLCSSRLVMPDNLSDGLEYLSGKVFSIDTKYMEKILNLNL